MTELVWWEVESRDPSTFQEFFTSLFGWRFESAFQNTDLGSRYWIIRRDDATLGGLQEAAERGRSPQTGTRIYFETTDLEGTLARVEELGGSVERGRTELGGDDRWFATFTDPTGISFGLWTATAQRVR